MTDVLVELDDVTVVFGAVTAVTGCSLSVAAGEIGVLGGRSGSGKTTALMSALGLVRPTSGRVRWRGIDVYALSEGDRDDARRTTIGTVLQDGGLLDDLTAEENVLLPAAHGRVRPADRARAADLLDRVGLADRRAHLPAELSGGERQRVAIARAQMTSPAVLVLDEPTASLDRASADRVIALITELAEQGVAVLTATHDPELSAVAHHMVALT